MARERGLYQRKDSPYWWIDVSKESDAQQAARQRIALIVPTSQLHPLFSFELPTGALMQLSRCRSSALMDICSHRIPALSSFPLR